MATTPRTTWLKATALALAAASLTINFGISDLVDGFFGIVDESRNQVLDAGWGAVFGLVLPLGLLAQLRQPERRIAGVQQVGLVALALLLAGGAGAAWWYLVLVAGIGAAVAVLLALHPGRKAFLARGEGSNSLFLALAALIAGPGFAYALRMASAQRRDLPPSDAVSNGLHHWAAMSALAIVVVLLVLLAGLQTAGWQIAALSAAAASGAWAVSCLLAPAQAAGSAGHHWAWAVLVWAASILAATLRRTKPVVVTPSARADLVAGIAAAVPGHGR